MSKTLSLNIEIKDESGAVNKKEELISFEINNPKHIKDLGLSHAEQIEILKKIIDNILPEQINLMEKIEKCPSCLNKTNKQGSFGSRFSSVFTDHKVIMQRYTCKNCGWVNKFTIDGLFGSDTHPDLQKIQCELGTEHSFKKAENILKLQNTRHRPINSSNHIFDTITKIGSILSDFKKETPVEIEAPCEFLVAQVDGGHIQSKEKEVRGYEVLAAKFYDIHNRIEKDENHSEIIKSTCVASAILDHGETMKKYMMYGALSEGMTSKTTVFAVSDGAENCWNALRSLSGYCGNIIYILDWEHIGRRFKHIESSLSEDGLSLLESAKWKLWHGLYHDCVEKLEQIDFKYFNCENKKLNSLIYYIKNNENHLINYSEYRTAGLPYTSNVIESAIGTVINSRQKENKRMSWTRDGAHNILQIRTSIASKTWDRDWDDAFEVLISA